MLTLYTLPARVRKQVVMVEAGWASAVYEAVSGSVFQRQTWARDRAQLYRDREGEIEPGF